MNPTLENKTVGLLSEILALGCGYSPTKAKQIGMAAVLHDVGKIRIPKHICDKPGKLNDVEFETMKNHTKIGFEMLSGLMGELGETARIMALYHHEHWQGPGYWGVPSATLPEYVGIVSLCDVLTALSAKRPYKEPWPSVDVLDYITKQAGTQFNPKLVNILLTLIATDPSVSAIFTEVEK